MKTRSFALVALAFLALGFVACGGDDPPADPVVELLFFHASETLGTIDVTVDGTTEQVAPSAISGTIEAPPGEVTFTVANTGALQPLFSETTTLAEGRHVFVIAGDQADDTLGAFEVGLDAPLLEAGTAAFQVASVVTANVDVDVYASTDAAAQQVGRYGQSDFFVVTPADAQLRIYNAGDDPTASAPLINLDAAALNMEPGGTYVVLLTGNLTGLDTAVARIQ